MVLGHPLHPQLQNHSPERERRHCGIVLKLPSESFLKVFEEEPEFVLSDSILTSRVTIEFLNTEYLSINSENILPWSQLSPQAARNFAMELMYTLKVKIKFWMRLINGTEVGVNSQSTSGLYRRCFRNSQLPGSAKKLRI